MDFEDDGLQEEGQVRDRPDPARGHSFLAQARWVCAVRPRGAAVWDMRKLWPGSGSCCAGDGDRELLGGGETRNRGREGWKGWVADRSSNSRLGFEPCMSFLLGL